MRNFFESLFSPSEREPEKVQYNILESKEGRQLILERTDKLIDLVQEQNIASLVFFDRSARPLSWIFRERWKHRLSNQKQPKVHFLNIGRSVNNSTEMGRLREYVGTVASQRSSPGEPLEIVTLVSAQERRPSVSLTTLPDMIPDAMRHLRSAYPPTPGEGSTLLIDEVAESGLSLDVGLLLFASAHPDHDVAATHLFRDREWKSVPWLHLDDRELTGMHDDDTILAKPITASNAALPLERIEEKLPKHLVNEAATQVRSVLVEKRSELARIDRAVERQGNLPISSPYDFLYLRLTEAIQTMQRLSRSSSVHDALDVLRASSDFVSTMGQFGSQDGAEAIGVYLSATSLQYTLKKILRDVPVGEDNLLSVLEQMRWHEQASEYRARSIQLRRELQRLAGEEAK
jgi:hypothetical protein